MEEPSLPVVYTQLGGQEINCLHGYMQDMGNQAARESISVLPEDRGLHIRIQEYGNTVTGISYEVRNLTMDRLGESWMVARESQKPSSESRCSFSQERAKSAGSRFAVVGRGGRRATVTASSPEWR